MVLLVPAADPLTIEAEPTVTAFPRARRPMPSRPPRPAIHPSR